MIADGTLAPDRTTVVDAHLRACGECASDVARLRTLVSTLRGAPLPAAAVDAEWPAIRARIDQAKMITIADAGASEMAAPRASVFRQYGWLGGIAAAAILTWVALPRLTTRHDDAASSARRDSVRVLSAASDSARLYEEEAQQLLNQLELRRSMLRPEAAASLDHDLRVIDSAIAEVKDAIARDPYNPTLRQMLALSYRHKLDALRRVGNAG